MAAQQSAVIDLRPTIVAKSDQLNSDDLIGTSITIKITAVKACGEPTQPIAICYEGDNGKPYKPCKSMRRVLVKVWGGNSEQVDAAKFIGRSLTLYRDDKVQFGGMAVGGIRISHMSDIDREVAMVLSESRAKRVPFTVKPLRDERPRQQAQTQQQDQGDRDDQTQTQDRPKAGLAGRIAAFKEAVTAQATLAGMDKAWQLSASLRKDIDAGDPEEVGTSEELQVWFNETYAAREDADKAGQF